MVGFKSAHTHTQFYQVGWWILSLWIKESQQTNKSYNERGGGGKGKKKPSKQTSTQKQYIYDHHGVAWHWQQLFGTKTKQGLVCLRSGRSEKTSSSLGRARTRGPTLILFQSVHNAFVVFPCTFFCFWWLYIFWTSNSRTLSMDTFLFTVLGAPFAIKSKTILAHNLGNFC